MERSESCDGQVRMTNSAIQILDEMQIKAHQTWADTPYDILWELIETIESGSELLDFLSAFKSSSKLGDLGLIAQIQALTGLSPEDVWPVLRLKNGMSDEAAVCIASACHLFADVVLLDMTNIKLLEKLIASRRPRVEWKAESCETKVCPDFLEGLRNTRIHDLKLSNMVS
jgi:hypothetical protein